MLTALLALAVAAPPLWGPLQPGPSPVGFRVADAGATPHRMSVAVWYPATGGGTPLVFRDYLVADVPEARRDAVVGELEGLLSAKKVDPATLLATPVHARRDATPARSAGTLVLIAQGNGQWAADQAVLAELLASHGMVVAAVPSIVNLTGGMTSTADVTGKVELEAGDLERAETAARRMFPRLRRVAVVGHSFGSRATLLYAMRHPVAALVSLDGGIGTATAVAETRAARGFDAHRKLPRALHLYEEVDAPMKPDFALLDSLRFEKLETRRLAGLHHWHFSTLGFTALLVPEVGAASQAGPELRESLEVLATETLAALR